MSILLPENEYMTLKEISDTLGVNPQTVGNKISQLTEGIDFITLNRPKYLFSSGAIPKLKTLRRGVSRNRRKKKEDV